MFYAIFFFFTGVVCVVGQDGGKIYGAKCASCHGKDGKGNPAMAKMFKVDNAALDFTDDTAGDTEENLRVLISKGKNKMPAYEGKIKVEEVDALVAYIRSLGAVKKTETK
ncbi:MAG: cytochrome c [Elusimicrobia bacterium]|nr:cytochrome c [Elusimicrobiota bacterium]